MADPGFDPRFDPAFQPGFDPNRHSPAAVVDVQPVAVASSDSITGAVESNPAVGARTAVRAAEANAAEPNAPVPPSRRNPLLIALWIVSAILVASGVYVLRLVADQAMALGTSGGFGESDYYLMQAYTVLAPLLITLGIATAIGTVFLLAVRWRAQR